MSLNRSWSTESIPMVKRLVCENALGHKNKLFRVKATTNHDHRLTLAAEIMQASIDQTYELAAMANGFKDCNFRGGDFTRLVNDLFPNILSVPERNMPSNSGLPCFIPLLYTGTKL